MSAKKRTILFLVVVLPATIMHWIPNVSLADWKVVVTSNKDPKGTSSDPIIVCKDDPTVCVTFTANATDNIPTETDECTVSGPEWTWSGDASGTGSSVSVSIPTTTAGTKPKSVTATGTFTYHYKDSRYPDCPDPSTQSGSGSVTVVVLNDVDGEWTNIRTPTDYCPILSPGTTIINETRTGKIPPEESPDQTDGWTWKVINSGKIIVTIGHDVLENGTTACARQTIITNSITYGLSATAKLALEAAWKCLQLSFSALALISIEQEYTYLYQFGSTTEYKKYRYEVWQQWENVSLNCNSIYAKYYKGSLYDMKETPLTGEYRHCALPDLKLDATCCSSTPNN